MIHRKAVKYLKDLKIPYLKPKRPRTNVDLLVSAIVVVFALLFVYDTIRLARILIENSGGTQAQNEAAPITQDDIVKVPEVTTPIQGPVCEYKDLLQKATTPPSRDDDIQKVIGYQNNKVGLYIYAEVTEFSDLAAELSNSNGGDWGYVLIPYNVKDNNTTRWGSLFQQLNEKHLIPIVQLWDLDLEDNKMHDQIKDSAKFLNTLQWPITNRYISVYNEPNDSKFWKGHVDPEQYAQVLDETIDAFNGLNEDFFMLNGAFNASARSGGDYLDEEAYLIKMNNEVPDIFKKLDGWASHPYPQPNFSGSPSGRGRDSIRAYDWELSVLKKDFGIDTSKLPVFITETGWAHRESEASEKGEPVGYRLDQYQVADYFKKAFEDVWMKDDKVVAVTPFTIRYNPPHDHFSWVTKNNNPYPQFDAVKNIEKVQGKPPVISYVKSKVIVCN